MYNLLNFDKILENRRVAKFHKVSYERFKKDLIDCLPNMEGKDSEIMELYNNIKLPKRATTGSAGYDFFAPLPLIIEPGQTIRIPTGIRCEMHDGFVLECYPRSGLGFKFRMQLDNTVGIIDSDYFYSDNEGHIMAKLTNDGHFGRIIMLDAGQGFMQGIFKEYYLTVDDEVTEIRNGGFGSTTK